MRDNAVAAGANHAFEKPFDFEALIAKVRTLSD